MDLNGGFQVKKLIDTEHFQVTVTKVPLKTAFKLAAAFLIPTALLKLAHNNKSKNRNR